MKLSDTIKGMPELTAKLEQMSDRRMAAAIATALTRVAVATRKEHQDAMRRDFDRPTPFAVNSVAIDPATASKLEARVYIRGDGANGTPPANVFMPAVQGGERRAKRFELALQALGVLPSGWSVTPGPGATLDAYGNISRAQINMLLTQLRAARAVGPVSKSGRSKQISAERKAGGSFFVVPPGGKGYPGVYQKEFLGESRTLVMVFVKGTAYKKRFDFQGVALQSASDRLPAELHRAANEHLARLASKGST